MFDNSASFLIILYNNIDSLLLIAGRLVGLFMMMPILRTRGLPRLGKMGFVFFIAMLLFTSKFDENLNVQYANSFIGFTMVWLKEFMIGYLLGFSVYTVTSIVYFSGQLLDYQLGFSMVNVFDPMAQMQIPVTGNILSLVINALLVLSGGLHVLLDAVFYSYDRIPIGTAEIVVSDTLIQILLNAMAYFFLFGVKVAMPIVGTILTVDISLGLLVKASPQMNVFVVGMPIKVLVGCTIFMLVIPMMAGIYSELFIYVSEMIYGVIEAFIK